MSIVKEGWLLQGSSVKKLTRKYFRLRGHELSCFKDDQVYVRELYFIVRGSELIIYEEAIYDKTYLFGVAPANSARKHFLRAEHEADRNAWLKAIRECKVTHTEEDAKPKKWPTSTKEGCLVKLGHVRKNWQKRYFVLTADWLKYYQSYNDKGKPKGEIDLTGGFTMALEAKADHQKDFAFSLTPLNKEGAATRTYIFVALDAFDRQEWMAAIRQYFFPSSLPIRLSQETIDITKLRGSNHNRGRNVIDSQDQRMRQAEAWDLGAILHHGACYKVFLDFSERMFCPESPMFWTAADKYVLSCKGLRPDHSHAHSDALFAQGLKLCQEFIFELAPHEININAQSRADLVKIFQPEGAREAFFELPDKDKVFIMVAKEIFKLMFQNLYNKFLTSDAFLVFLQGPK